MEKRMIPAVDYDSEADVAYLFLGSPYPTVNFELDQNFTLRLDPASKKLVGLVVHQYSRIYPMFKRSEDRGKICAATLTLLDQLLREKKLKEPIPA